MDKIDLWKDREKNKIDPLLYSDKAMKMAKAMREDHDKVSRGKKPNKTTQIRKFYDELVRLDMEAKKLDIRSETGQDRWDSILPLVHMLVAKAAYAEGRELVSKKFSSIIKSAVDQIEKPKDLAVFADFFEAFMGFYRLHGPKS